MANPLAAGVTGNEANVVFQRFDPQDEYAKNPARVISFLHDKALHDARRDILYALAELSHLYAGKLQRMLDSPDRERRRTIICWHQSIPPTRKGKGLQGITCRPYFFPARLPPT